MSAPAPAAPAASGTQQQAATVSQSALYLVGSRLREYATGTLEQRKPWTEVLDRTSFGKPANINEATTRIRKNLSYFKVNYLIVAVLTIAGSFLMHPSSLFVLGFLLASWVYLFTIRQEPVVINGKELSEREKFWGMSVGSFLMVFVFTSVGTLVFSAVMMSAAIICLHGATRIPDDLFLDDAQEGQGLLSIFVGAKPSPVNNV